MGAENPIARAIVLDRVPAIRVLLFDYFLAFSLLRD